MLTVNPQDIKTALLHHYLIGAIGPRPIALASTTDKNGNSNLSPFSFFNVFSSKPPILVFSPALSGREAKKKDTLNNVLATKEVVINVVTHSMAQQMALSSSPYDASTDEFIKSGLTPLASETVTPFRVKESPVQFECKVNEVIALGKEGGAGNLVICEVIRIHINKAILDDAKMIDQQKIDLVSRMGGNWYCRADKNSMFQIEKPATSIGIGVDQIPFKIRTSTILTGNDLGLLGSVEALPSEQEINSFNTQNGDAHTLAKALIEKGEILKAWKVLLKA